MNTANRESSASLERHLGSQIFLIDDEEIVLEILIQYLETAGFKNIHGFTCASEAIDTLRYISPDVILTDIHMPEVSGNFLTKLIRTYDHLRLVPIVAVTADSNPETAAAIMRKGANSVLAKPVHEDVLVNHLIKVLKHASHIKSREQEEIKKRKHDSVAGIRDQESQLRRLSGRQS